MPASYACDMPGKHSLNAVDIAKSQYSRHHITVRHAEEGTAAATNR